MFPKDFLHVSVHSIRLGILALAVGLLVAVGVLPIEAVAGVAFIGMAFPADALDVVDLRALADGGLVKEDLYRKVFFLQTASDTPFTNLIGVGQCNSDKTEWAFDNIAVPVLTNKHVAGSRPTTFIAATGSRVAARAQIFRKAISISSTAQASQLAGDIAPLAYETDKALKALRQDVEASFCSNLAGIVGDNNATAQQAAGFSSWVITNDSLGATGAALGYNTTTHIVDAPTFGTARALSWALVTGLLLGIYNSFGNVRYLMSTPALIQKLNQKITDGTIKVATPQANVTGNEPAKQVGQGYFTGVISDFGFMLTFVPNRSQQTYNTGKVDVFLIDPDMVEAGYHEGYNVVELGKSSALSTERDIVVSATVLPRREAAHGVVRDIDPTLAVTA